MTSSITTSGSVDVDVEEEEVSVPLVKPLQVVVVPPLQVPLHEVNKSVPEVVVSVVDVEGVELVNDVGIETCCVQ